jgi:F-type H+-transporting ATPase subunit epsilon
MSRTFQFELVSPEKMLVSKPVVMATMPGIDGVFGVLADHSPLITSMQPGVIDVCEQNEADITERYFVAGGFVEISANICTVLAEEAVAVSSLDLTAIDQEARELTEKLVSANDNERARLESKLATLRAKLAVIG